MKKSILFIILLLTAVSVFALDADYLVVVESTAPASDVVTAANFAASMKASTGVTFQSALDIELDGKDLSGKTVVYIRGDTAEVVGTGSVAKAAKEYFNDQDIEVSEKKVTKSEPITPVKIETKVNTTLEVVVPPVLPAEAPPSPPQETQQKPFQDVPPPEETPKETVPEKPGVFVRFWVWIKGLF